MNADTQAPSPDVVARFWDSFRNELYKQGVKEKAHRWYAGHAKRFIDHWGSHRLLELQAKDITEYLDNLGRSQRLEDWQIAQAAHAMQILFCQVLKRAWCQEVDWQRWRESARALPAHHPTVARDYQGPILAAPPFENKGSAGPLYSVRVEHKATLTRLVSAIRQRQYSIRTEQAYEAWACRYIAFHGSKPPQEMGATEVRAFLEHLVVEGKVSASTQNQALNALVFLYDQVLEQPFGDLEQFARSKRPRRLPVVLSRQEARTLIGALSGVHQLMAGLLYGSGMRLMECIRLRVQDVDFDYHQIVVRNAKGNKDRVVPLPQQY